MPGGYASAQHPDLKPYIQPVTDQAASNISLWRKSQLATGCYGGPTATWLLGRGQGLGLTWQKLCPFLLAHSIVLDDVAFVAGR